MVREISAGGVVVRKATNEWEMAAIEPQREPHTTDNSPKVGKKTQKVLLALPKGLIDAGEKPQQTAVREVFEETGVHAQLVTKLGDTKYTYVRTWGDRAQVFKVVSFYLLHYVSGEINDIDEEMRVEVKRALWIPLEGATKRLAYKGEKQMVSKALEYLEIHDLETGKEKCMEGGK
jgi:8-oxo-dGTP pyrophosphatase MutT (NUDIX family)